MTDADGYNAIDPIVFRVCRLEQWNDPKIVARRIHRLTFLDSFDDIGRTMAHPLVSHADQSVIGGLEDKPYIERRGAISPDRLPIAATVQDLS